VDVNNPQQLQQQLTNPGTAVSTATAISQALAAQGNNCGSGIGQAIARELSLDLCGVMPLLIAQHSSNNSNEALWPMQPLQKSIVCWSCQCFVALHYSCSAVHP
jgi:hypothetical protein